MKSTENNLLNKEEKFSKDEIVDIIDEKEKQSYEGKIIEMKDDIITVENMKTKKVESYPKKENKVIKLWKPDRQLKLYNRVDFELSNTNYYVEGVIIDINKEKNEVLVKYHNNNKFKKICEVWTSIDSGKVAPVNQFTPLEKDDKSSSSNNNKNEKLLGKKTTSSNNSNNSNIVLNEDQELIFEKIMKRNNFEIQKVSGDGNCLFRAVSDQVYGTDIHYDIIRQKCMDYLQVQKRFFEHFIEGDFDEYIKIKRKDGTWGDDIELEALSEIYDRPIEIYSGSEKPLKCFHEKNSHVDEKKVPIRLSYHGHNHYNSAIPLKDAEYKYKMYENNLIKTPPGTYEEKILTIAIENEENFAQGIKLSEEEEYLKKLQKSLSRKKFKEYLDQLLLDVFEDFENKKANEDGLDSDKEKSKRKKISLYEYQPSPTINNNNNKKKKEDKNILINNSKKNENIEKREEKIERRVNSIDENILSNRPRIRI